MSDTEKSDGWRILELASIRDAVPDEGDFDVDSILAIVDWEQLIVTSLRHRLMPRLADFLIRSDRMSFVPRDFCRVLVRALHENRYRCASLTGEAARVVAAMAERDVVVACTKGVAFQSTLYRGFGGRSFDDIDLMIRQEDKNRAAEVLLEQGFLANMYHDLESDRMMSLPRSDVTMYRLYPDHLPHFLRPLTGHAISHFTVDVCFNITWFGANWRIPMSEVLDDVRRVEVTAGTQVISLPVLAAPYDFVFTAMHLFREGWFERTITAKNLRLGQFADLWRMWHSLDRSVVAELAALIDKHTIAPPIAWACHHVDQIFGSEIVGGLDLRDHCDPAWLYSARAMDGSYLSWAGDMRARIRSGKPPRLVPAPEPRPAAEARVGGR